MPSPQVCRATSVTGCCSALQDISVFPSLALPTTAVPQSATLITATITASAHTIHTSFQFAGKNVKRKSKSFCSPRHILFACVNDLYLGISCLAGDDFWFMGERCDVRMTRARLIGACLAILLIIVTVIIILAFVAVRRYRAILIQAKVDQTRSR